MRFQRSDCVRHVTTVTQSKNRSNNVNCIDINRRAYVTKLYIGGKDVQSV